MAANQSRDGSPFWRYERIPDNYRTLHQVTEALAESGLESSNLIVGIDFTKSNEWTGRYSFGGRCLHSLCEDVNPYEHAFCVIGRTLSRFDEDNLIPCFGFGDVTTRDRDVFSFYAENRPCDGFEDALNRYREIVPHIRLAGPTSFAPIIETAIEIVDQSGGQYHVLLIIADGQVTGAGQSSLQEQNTVNAIVKASKYPLSIIMVGVGDGPWDKMEDFDDNIPARAFDNFQFVNFTEIMSRNFPSYENETEFALAALMEIPLQYRATLELHLLGNQRGQRRIVAPPPPPLTRSNNNNDSLVSGSNSFSRNSVSSSPPCPVSTNERKCPVCLRGKRDLALGCGHQLCQECGQELGSCPICRTEIVTRIQLYD